MTISSQIIDVIDNVCNKFGIVIDWSQKNILPYIMELGQKLIKYEIATSIIWIIIMGILSFVLFKAYKYCTKEEVGSYYDFDWVIITIAIISGVIITLVIGKQIFDITECIVFPEKYIIEFWGNLASK